VTKQDDSHAVNIPYPTRRYAWFVVGVLILASLIAFIDRQVVAIVVEPMKVDLDISDTEIGWLYGVFAIFYAAAALPIAAAADKRSRKHIIAIGIFFWSLMTMACGLTRGYWEVFLARIGVGVGEATLSPSTTSLIGDYFPRDDIPLALSIFQIGPIAGSGVAFIIGGLVLGIVQSAEPLVLPIVGTLVPWQQTFLYVGAPGIVLAFFFLGIREPVRRPSPTAADDGSQGMAELIAFYRTHARTLTLHHLGFVSLVLTGYAFVFWSVTFLVRIHGEPAAEASTTFGWIFLIFGPLGPVFVAWIARRLSARGHGDANITAGMIGGLLTLPAVLLLQLAPDAFWAYVLYAPALLAVNSPFGIAAGALPVITPPHLRARVAAVYMLAGSTGMMFGPPLAGAFNDHLFPGPDGVRYSMITMTSIFGLIGVVLLWFARKPYAQSLTLTSDMEADAVEETVPATVSP
jgi:MFS family permease|tara:strand:+ start:3422 stop:4804 length:1383 start_codon:yes stop_codon:yes gene_type:complete